MMCEKHGCKEERTGTLGLCRQCYNDWLNDDEYNVPQFYEWLATPKDYPLRPGEVVFTDPTTGGQKGTKPEQLTRLLEMAPPAFLTDLGKVYEMGARKYSKDNWRKGYPWTLSFDAALRHLRAAINGEWVDPESDLPHVCHVAWHMATLHEYQRAGLGTDDRIQ